MGGVSETDSHSSSKHSRAGIVGKLTDLGIGRAQDVDLGNLHFMRLGRAGRGDPSASETDSSTDGQAAETRPSQYLMRHSRYPRHA